MAFKRLFGWKSKTTPDSKNYSSEASNGGKTDFIILRDEVHKSKKRQHINTVLEKLHSKKLTGNIHKGQPGLDKDKEFRMCVSDADYVVCAFETKKGISPTYCDQVIWSHSTKRRQDADARVIPVFCDMTAEEADALLDRHTGLAFLKLYVAAYTKDEDCLEAIMHRITTPSLESHLRLHYDEVLPRSCMALLRTDMAQENWLSQYVPLRYNMKTFSGSDVSERPVNNIVHAVESLVGIRTVLIYGDEGTGKSSSLNHLATAWNKGFGLVGKFSHLYLIPIRQINNPTSPLEHIICRDLKLVPLEQEQAVRRFIMFNSSAILWLLDGYDERTDHGDEEFTINKLISGEFAPKSTVIVSSRPHSAHTLSDLVKLSKSEIYLSGFDEIGVKEYLRILPQEWAPEYSDLNNLIPRELLNLPLFLAMVSYVYKKHYERSDKGDKGVLQFFTIRSVLDDVVGILLGVMEEKRTGRHLSQYSGYRDSQLPPTIKRIAKAITKLAFESIRKKQLFIDIGDLEEHATEEEIKNIGILHFEKRDQRKVSFIHLLFQEHAAAYHMSENEDAVRDILKALKNPGLMTSSLGVFSSPLVFAVGLNSSVLGLVIQINMPLPVVKVYTKVGSTSDSVNLDLELSYQARLLHACSDTAIKQDYLKRITGSKLPRNPVVLSHQPDVEVSAYIDLIDCLGLEGCLSLLKKVHKDRIRVDEDKVSLSVSRGSTTRCITDTFLLGCLPVVDIKGTDRLIIKYANFKVLQHTAVEWKWKVQKQSGRIKELVLQELECSVSELHLLLRTLAETADTCLTIDGSCSITQHDGDIVKDEPEIRLKQLTVKANMSSQSLQALLKPLAVGSVYIHDCNILNEGQENNLFTEQKEVTIKPHTYKAKCSRHNSHVYLTYTPGQQDLHQEQNHHWRVKIGQALSLQVVGVLLHQTEDSETDAPCESKGKVGHFILDGVEMNPKGLRQLYRLYQTRDTSDTNCQFEVTDEGESGLEMTYDSTAAFSCVTTVGSPSCVSTCSMYQGTDDWMDEVNVSVKEPAMDDVIWWTSDVHSLMRSLRLTHLNRLAVTPSCKLRYSPPSASLTSRVNVDLTEIQASLSINMLVALLSNLNVIELWFLEDCKVLDMSGYSPPPPQVSISVKEIGLVDVRWRTSDVHSLMESLCLTYLDSLFVLPWCKLRHSPPSVSPTSQVKVDQVQIGASLTITTLVGLLSQIEMEQLWFLEECQVLDTSSYSPPSPQTMSLKKLWLVEIHWSVSDLVDLIRGLCVTHLDELILQPACELSDSQLVKHICHVNNTRWEAPLDILVMRTLLDCFPSDSVKLNNCKIMHCESDTITIGSPPREIILYEVVDVRRLSTLYVPGTREVKVTWLNQDHTITDTQLAAIFPDAIINSTDDCG